MSAPPVVAAVFALTFAAFAGTSAAQTGARTPQPTLPSLPTTLRPLPEVPRAAVEAGGIASELGVAGAKCGAILERGKGLVTTAQAFERLDATYLGPLSNVLTAAKAADLGARGRYGEMTQVISLATLDTVICRPGGHVAGCAAWMVGRTIGDLLNETIPRAMGNRSVNDWLTDRVYDAYNYGEVDLLRTLEAARDEAARLRREADDIQRERPQCSVAAAKPVVRYSPGSNAYLAPTPVERSTPLQGGSGSTAPVQGACQQLDSC